MACAIRIWQRFLAAACRAWHGGLPLEDHDCQTFKVADEGLLLLAGWGLPAGPLPALLVLLAVALLWRLPACLVVLGGTKLVLGLYVPCCCQDAADGPDDAS
jgi:hypothetical protein